MFKSSFHNGVESILAHNTNSMHRAISRHKCHLSEFNTIIFAKINSDSITPAIWVVNKGKNLSKESS